MAEVQGAAQPTFVHCGHIVLRSVLAVAPWPAHGPELSAYGKRTVRVTGGSGTPCCHPSKTEKARRGPHIPLHRGTAHGPRGSGRTLIVVVDVFETREIGYRQ